MICQTRCDTSQLEKREVIYHQIFTKCQDRDEKRRQGEGWINKRRKGMGVRKEEEEEGVIMMHAWSDRMVSSRSGRTGFPIRAENRFKKHVRVIHAVDWGGTVVYREFGGGDKTLPAIQTLHNTASLMQPQHKARRLLTPCKWILQSARCCILHAWWITPFINQIIPLSTAVNAAELPECKVRRVIWLNIWILAKRC